MKKIVLSLLISSLLLSVGCSASKTTQKDNGVSYNKDIHSSIQISESDVISEDKIFAYIESDSSLATEPPPENLLIDSYSVIKMKVLSVDNSKFIESLNYDKPLTPINIEVLDVLSENNLSGNIQINTFGGTILISELIKHQPEQTTIKMGLDKLSKEKQSSDYIKYTSESDYDLEIGKEYVVILDKQPNGIYTIATNGYGIFEPQNGSQESKGISYKNVLTNNKFIFKIIIY